MHKQMVPACVCGHIMYFPVGKVESRCPKCRAPWKQGSEGYWAGSGARHMFTPIYTKPVKVKLNHYQKYMQWRNGRAGKRC